MQSIAYIRFVDSSNANEPGAAWPFHECVHLVDAHASYIVDVLRDGQIGGIEFIAMLPFVR